MSHIYAFLAAGIIGAAVALYVWLKEEPQQHRNNRGPPRPPPSPSNSNSSGETGDVSPPRYFESGANCIVCCEKPSEVKFVPCLHACMCSECHQMYLKYDRKCPLCRMEIDHTMSA